MKSKYSLRPVLVLLLMTVCLCNCKQKTKEPIKVDDAFTKHIAGFTAGAISNQSTIRVQLVEDNNDAQSGDKVEDKLFSFQPKIDGEAYWVNKRVIEFRPSKPLPSGKQYEAKFYLSKVKNVKDKFKTLDFQFDVIKQAVEVQLFGLQPYSNTDLTWQKLSGSVRTYDYVEPDLLEETFTLIHKNQNISLKWDHYNNGKSHSFVADSIKRSDKATKAIVSWDGKKIGIKDKGNETMEIPSIYEFKVLNIQSEQEPQQMVTIYLSAPIDKDQNLVGLIYFKEDANPRIVKNGSELKIYPSKRLTGDVKLFINEQLQSVKGKALGEAVVRDFSFYSIKPALELIGDGVILPSSNNLLFPFRAVGLNAVDVKIIRIYEDNIPQFLQNNQLDQEREMKRVGRIIYKDEVALTSKKAIDFGNWNNYSLDLADLIAAEPGAIYRVFIGFNIGQSVYPCSEELIAEFQPEVAFEDDAEVTSYDSPSYYNYRNYYYNDYNYSERNDPCKPSYYYRGDKTISRNLLASDLGIIAKGSNSGSMVVAVTDLVTTNPKAGVTLEIYNFQQQLIASKVTDGDGIVEIDLNNKPFLLVAKKDKQRGYLRLDDGSALSLSMFDIGGQKTKKGVKGFLYGERGVWRPGDSLFLSFILEDEQNALPDNHPVVFELYTPQRQFYKRIVRTSNLNGFYDFKIFTEDDAPTGNWEAKIKVGGSIFTKRLKIEAIKPNRLKLNLSFDKDILYKGEINKGELEVKWLHGAIAKNLKADVEMTLSKTKTTFENFKDYSFDDAAKDFSSEDNMIFDGQLDNEGIASIQPDIAIGNSAPGMLRAIFKIRAFEKGGDFSVNQKSILYSPYDGYVGVKIPEGKGWNGALYADETTLIPIVTVDEKGQPVNRKNLKVEVFNVYWRWWWQQSDHDNIASYISNKTSNLLQSATVSTKNGKAMFEMKFDRNYYGRKYIRVTDPKTGHSTGQLFYTTYKNWYSNADGNNPGGAEMLTFSADKKKYEVGEKTTITIPAAKKGRALVSIESGSKILQTFWKEMSAGSNQFSFTTTSEMAPNVYVNITLIQPHENTINDLPIRLYGVQPIKISDKATHLNPTIDIPDELAPNEKYIVKVGEQNGKKMTYTLAVVDEGLLDLTNFKTPNPWSHFYAKEALSVKTWDMYKYVLGAFSGEMAGLLALGGDEFLKNKENSKANRFKPVVSFLGPFEVRANGKNVHEIKMPNYIGSVRAMVIAAEDGAYGRTEETVPVKQPLMVLATMPRVIGPGEKVSLPVTVFAMDEKIKNVKIEVKSNDFFLSKDALVKQIKFNEVGDQVINFDFEVAEQLGIGKLEVIVTSGTEKASYQVELDVRPSNPRITKVEHYVLEPGKSMQTDYSPIGMAGTNDGILEISSLPPINLDERLQYLMRYPHGCIEQTTSSIFPQLFLSQLLDLSEAEQQEIEFNIKAGIERIRTFQIASGGLSYWPGDATDASNWGTNYAGHFMLEAQAKGYAIPAQFLSKWKQYQKSAANDWRRTNSGNNYYDSNELIQAYRLYTLALAGDPVIGAMNRLKNQEKLSSSATWRLAAAYFMIGKKEIAVNMIDDLTTDIKPYKELSNSYGSSERDRAMILETLTLMKDISAAKPILDDLSKAMSSGRWYSTQTTAYSLLAIAKFINNSGAGKELDINYKINSQAAVDAKVSSPITQVDLGIQGISPGEIKLTNNGENTVFVQLQLAGIPIKGDEENIENNLSMKVRYLNMEEVVIDPSSLVQGTDFIAEVTIGHPGVRAHYSELALEQIFPSGWEIRNLRMDLAENSLAGDQPEYEDVRDDRVYTYFDLSKQTSKTYRVLLNAAYIGDYYLPTIYCSAMYDNEINATEKGMWVEVVSGN